MGRRDGSIDWGARLREYRSQLGIPQRECAKLVGAPVNAWALWERGEREPGPGWRRRLDALLERGELPSPMGQVGQSLKLYREELALSQAEAAEHLGVSLRTYQRWESGAARPGLENAGRIWRVVDRDMREVY